MIVGGLLALVAGYVAAGAYFYDVLTLVEAECAGPNSAYAAQNVPTDFAADNPKPSYAVDVSGYQMSAYETVRFSARDEAEVTISGWFVRSGVDDAPVVIVVHGVRACRRVPSVLISAGMLARNGFDVLMMDLRNHGASTVTNGRFAAGIYEYRDVLGAWDWLQAQHGYAPEQIGVLGLSLGAASAMIAMDQEADLMAVWADSPYAELDVAVADELQRLGIPLFIMQAGYWVAQVTDQVDLHRYSPIDVLDNLDGRALYLTHGLADERLSATYTQAMAAYAEARGIDVGVWLVPDRLHIQAMFQNSVAYEQRLVRFFRRALAENGVGGA